MSVYTYFVYFVINYYFLLQCFNKGIRPVEHLAPEIPKGSLRELWEPGITTDLKIVIFLDQWYI